MTTDTDTAGRLPDRFSFLMPVWGPAYIDRFLTLALPAHLAAGNSPALPADRCRFRIFTREKDLPLFRGSEPFRRFDAEHNVVFETIDDMDLTKQPYLPMTACYERGMAADAGVDTAFFFLTPDSFCSAGGYAAILRRMAEGKRAVLTVGLRASLPPFRAELDRLRPAPGEWPDLPPRTLVRIALDNLHPLSAAHLVEDGNNRSLGHYYWRVGRHGLVARCFHIHPLMVWPATPHRTLYTTLDHDFVRTAVHGYSQVHVVTDSDELTVVEVSDPSHLAHHVSPRAVSRPDFLFWVSEQTNSFHRRHFTENIVLHGEPLTDEYTEVSKAADGFAAGVLAEFAAAHPHPPDHMIVALRMRALATETADHSDAPPPPKRGLYGTLTGAVGKAYLRFLRLFARPLFDRTDALELAVRVLTSQRRQDAVRMGELSDANRALADQLMKAEIELSEQLRLLRRELDRAKSAG